ncbi:hypothetical protein BGZ63DRAFT_370060 [Mariannaea sp. PMI_226]|nr:hypothetical protein BGZ63DRAFT_370060 [Mariannaea sp. PMI_226]
MPIQVAVTPLGCGLVFVAEVLVCIVYLHLYRISRLCAGLRKALTIRVADIAIVYVANTIASVIVVDSALTRRVSSLASELPAQPHCLGSLIEPKTCALQYLHSKVGPIRHYIKSDA